MDAALLEAPLLLVPFPDSNFQIRVCFSIQRLDRFASELQAHPAEVR